MKTRSHTAVEATMENMARLMSQMAEDNIKFGEREAEREGRQVQQVMELEEIRLKNDLQGRAGKTENSRNT